MIANPCRPGTAEWLAWEDQSIAAAEIDAERELPGPDAPMAVARVLERQRLHDGLLTLRHWRGGWIRWDRSRWAEDEERSIKAWVYGDLEHAIYADDSGKGGKGIEIKPWNPNRRRVGDVLDALQGITLLAETVDSPSWLDPGPDDMPAGEVVACENGLLHVRSRKLVSHTPRFFNLVAVPFDYHAEAPEPKTWLDFLEQLWPDDPDAIMALAEFFGYVLSGRTDLQKIMMLIGPTRSGKGTIARVLSALVGRGNVAGPTLASLATNFGLSPLLGKPLAVVSDARLGGSNGSAVVERLLTISGEDLLTVDRKYREPWTGKLSSRLLILSNELPRFGDASGAIANRFVILPMTNSFLGSEDTRLTIKLEAELPGILNWALDGLDRLSRNGMFTAPAASTEAVRALQDIASPVGAFVRDLCVLGAEHTIPVGGLYEAWREWCDINGNRVSSAATLGRDLRSHSPGVRIIQPRVDGGRERHYVGIALRPDSKHDNGHVSRSTHNRADRVPTRASDPPDAMARVGTRDNPLWVERGNACEGCGDPLDPVNLAEGHTTHPGCEPS